MILQHTTHTCTPHSHHMHMPRPTTTLRQHHRVLVEITGTFDSSIGETGSQECHGPFVAPERAPKLFLGVKHPVCDASQCKHEYWIAGTTPDGFSMTDGTVTEITPHRQGRLTLTVADRDQLSGKMDLP